MKLRCRLFGHKMQTIALHADPRDLPAVPLSGEGPGKVVIGTARDRCDWCGEVEEYHVRVHV